MIWIILLVAWVALGAYLSIWGEIKYQRYRREWERSHPGLSFEDWRNIK